MYHSFHCPKGNFVSLATGLFTLRCISGFSNDQETIILVFEFSVLSITFSANIYLFKVNNRNTRNRREICSKLTIKTPEQCQGRRSGVLLLILNIFLPFSSVSIVDFEQVNVSLFHNISLGMHLKIIHPQRHSQNPRKYLRWIALQQ